MAGFHRCEMHLASWRRGCPAWPLLLGALAPASGVPGAGTRARAWRRTDVGQRRGGSSSSAPGSASLSSDGKPPPKAASWSRERFPLEGAKPIKIGAPKDFFLEGYAIAGRTVIKANCCPTATCFPRPLSPLLQTSRGCIWSQMPDPFIFPGFFHSSAGLLSHLGNNHGADLAHASWG